MQTRAILVDLAMGCVAQEKDRAELTAQKIKHVLISLVEDRLVILLYESCPP